MPSSSSRFQHIALTALALAASGGGGGDPSSSSFFGSSGDFGRVDAFAPPVPPAVYDRGGNLGGGSFSSLHMSSTSGAARTGASSRRNSNNNTARRKKSVRDRSSEEVVSLVRDIVQAVADAGPKAGPARTFQAYLALTQTVRDFLPIPSSPSSSFPFPFPQPGGGRQGGSGGGGVGGGGAEEFSAPVALRKLFERLGATYVKLGQFVASSPTLFPKEYVLEFQKCLDKTEALEWDVIKDVIEKELGPVSNTFSYVDKTPLASASIAQVHSAKLKSTGEDVVIKVQKPRIDESLKADLGFIYVASRVLEFIQPDWERTSLSAIAGDLRQSMLEELDFVKEANNVIEFREFLAVNGLEGVATAPRVYNEYTTKKVLTMERLDGVSMLDIDAISRITKNDPESTIVTALNVWTTSVLTMPWFHADVHAGNLLVLKDDGRVGFIDFGIVGRVGSKTFQAVNDMSTALAVGDYEAMARALCDMGAADTDVDTEKFGEDIKKVIDNLSQVQPTDVTLGMSDGTIQGRLDFDENEITQVLLDIVDVTENNGLKLPREFGLLVKQSLYFDRYIKILAPELDVVSDVRVGFGGGNDGEQQRVNGGAGRRLPSAPNGSAPPNGLSEPPVVVIDV